MKRFLIAIFVSIVLTALFVVLTAIGGGACHCSRPVRIFFPLAAMLGVDTNWPALGFLQFLIYTSIVAMTKDPAWKARIVLIFLAFHAWLIWLAFKLS
jgi:hypothetical protein